MNPPVPRAAPAEQLHAWIDRHRFWLLGGMLLFHLAAFNGQWRVGSDSALYATIARNLVEGHGYTGPTSYAQQVHPGVPLLLGGTFAAFGMGVFWPAVVLFWLTALATLTLVYRLVELYADRPSAVAVTLLVGLNRSFLEHSHELLTDIPFLFGLMLLLLGHEQLRQRVAATWRCVALMALGLVLMALFRSVVLTVLAAAGASGAIGLVRGGRRQRRVMAVAAAAVVAGLALFYLLDPRSTDAPRDEMIVIQKLLAGPGDWFARWTATVPKLLEDALPPAIFGIEWGPGLNSVMGLAVIGLGVLLVRKRPLWGILVAAFIAQFLTFDVTRRYFIVILPLLALGWWSGVDRLGRVDRAWAPVLAVVMLAAWLGPNVARSVGVIIEQRRRPFLEHYDDGRYATMRQAAAVVAEHTPPDARIMMIGDPPAVLSFWSQRRVISAWRLRQVDWLAGPAFMLVPDMEAAVLRVWRAGYEPTGEELAQVPVRGGERWILTGLRRRDPNAPMPPGLMPNQ